MFVRPCVARSGRCGWRGQPRLLRHIDAARAALLASGAPVEPDIGRTHSGLIGAFGNYLVKNGPVSKDVGRLLNRAHEIRLVADYNGDSVEPSDAREMVEQADIFVAAMRVEFVPGDSNDDDRGVKP